MGEHSDKPEGAVSNGPAGDLVGATVDVRSRFEGTWCSGFQVAEVLTNLDRVLSYRVKRVSDGQTLPGTFSADEVERPTGGSR